MYRSNRSVVALVALVVLLLAMSVGPALAAGSTPTTGNVPTTGRFTSMVYTASSGGLPQGAFIDGQYVRLATPDCPVPARMLVDGVFTFKCPPPKKLPPLPRPRLLP